MGLLEASPDGIIATDPSGKILMCNRRAAEVHGYANAAELLGKPAPMLIAPVDRQRVRASILATVTEGRPVGLECQILRNGAERSGELTAAPYAPATAPSRKVTIVHDITERKEADHALRRERSSPRTPSTPSPASSSCWTARGSTCGGTGTRKR